MKSSLLLFLSALALSAQVTTNYPVVTLSASAGTPIYQGVKTTSGTANTLTWTFTGTACPAGSCTGLLFARQGGTGGIHTNTSETVANGSASVSPTTTTEYQFQVACPSCISNGAANGIVASSLPFWIVVGPGTLGATLVTSAQDGGPGVPSPSMVGKMVEATINNTLGGCSTYVGFGVTTHACATGAHIVNPWMDGWGFCTWTGQGSAIVITSQIYYQGGANSGSGDHWKCRFNPPVADTWNLTGLYTDATDYFTFSSTSLFVSVTDPNYSGQMQISGVSSRAFKTSNGQPFTPIGMNIQCSDIGNSGCGSGSWNQSLGENPSPSNPSPFSSNAPFALALSNYTNAGVNFISVSDDNVENWASMTTANLNIVFIGYGVAGTNSTSGHLQTTGGSALDSALETLQAQELHSATTCEYNPNNTYFTAITGNSPFTTPTTTFLWGVGLQYCINRWSSLSDVLLFGNEQTNAAGHLAWVSTSALYMKQNDPYLAAGFGRLITASINSGNSQFIADQNIDIDDSHQTFSTANAGSTLAVPTAVADTVTACACTTPVWFGEYQGSGEVYPANLQGRSLYLSLFFSRAYGSIYPSGSVGQGQFVGNAQLVQIANVSTLVQNFDQAATALTVTLASQSCGGCAVSSLALGSVKSVGGYIWNNTSTVAVSSMTATWINPTANMTCEWINPLTGAVISTFNAGTAASHAYAVPTFSSAAVYQPDIEFICFAPATPLVTMVTAPAGSMTPSTTYSLTLTAAGGAGAPFTYAVTSGALPPGLTLSGGVISGVATTPGFWRFSIVATDSGSTASIPQNLIIPIMALPTIGNASTDNAVIGRAENASTSQVVVTGGCQPITSSMTATGLVSGLSIAANMQLSGTPTAAGSMTFTPSVTDACGNAIASPPTVAAVAPTPPGSSAIMFQTASANACTQGFLCQVQLQTRMGTGVTTFATTAGTLPTGLTLVTSPGSAPNLVTYIAGTNISGTTATVSVTPTDSVGAGPAQSYTITVNSPLTISTSSVAKYNSGSSYIQSFATSGGTLPNACFLAPGSGPLPAGFVLDTGTSTLYGPPLAGSTTYPFTVACYDSNHVGSTQTYNLQPNSSGFTTSLSPFMVEK